jgi:hypothetical protein
MISSLFPSKKNLRKMNYTLLILPSVLFLFLLSCGYSVVKTSSLPFRSIVLGPVENLTTEPGLQDIFVQVFTEESLKHGLHISKNEGPLLEVMIRHYRLTAVSLKSDLTAEYRVDLKADSRILFADGSSKEMKGMSSEFMETFVAPERIQVLHTEREFANEQAIRNLSQRIIAEMIYGNGE